MNRFASAATRCDAKKLSIAGRATLAIAAMMESAASISTSV